MDLTYQTAFKLSNSKSKYVLLSLGLLIWIFAPIIGIFPLILFVHFNRSQDRTVPPLNLIVLAVIALTTTIFISSQTIISDTAFYIETYEKLGTHNPFELAYGSGVEFMLPLLMYPVYLVSHGSRYVFLFCVSLLINLAAFYICFKFSKKNFALLIFFTITSPSFVFQIFIMRQFISCVFIAIAIANTGRKIYSLLFYILSFFTHTSSFVLAPIILLKINENSWIRNLFNTITNRLIFKILIVLLFPLSIFIGIWFASTAFGVFNLFSGVSNIGNKTNGWISYLEETSLSGESGISKFLSIQMTCVLLINLFFLKARRKSLFDTKKSTLMNLTLSFLILISFATSGLGAFFSTRLSFLLYSFSGIFYYQLLDYRWKLVKLKNKFVFCSLVLVFSKFLFSLYSFGNTSELNFSLNPFLLEDNTTLIEYIHFAYLGFSIDDLQIFYR